MKNSFPPYSSAYLLCSSSQDLLSLLLLAEQITLTRKAHLIPYLLDTRLKLYLFALAFNIPWIFKRVAGFYLVCKKNGPSSVLWTPS